MPSAPALSVPGYSLHGTLGTGTAGVVYRATSATSPASYAVKVIPAAKVRSAVRREVALHLPLSHPNIIRLHRVLPAHGPSPSPAALALITEHARAGDMFSEVSTAGPLRPRVLRRRLRDIVAALTYLHANNISHLDLKLENVVLTHSRTAKLIDFGSARRIASDSSDAPLGGTLQYLPPELVRDPTCPPNPAADAWSLGVLAYTALAGCYPFNGARPGQSEKANDDATRHRILHAHPHRFPACIDLPSDLRRIVYGLLEKDPAKRMTIPQVAQQLAASMDSGPIAPTPRLARPAKPGPHLKCDTTRPRSPSSPVDADFAPCHCDAEQTQQEALRVVDSIQRSRARAANEVRRYMSDLHPSPRKEKHRPTGPGNSKGPKRSDSGAWMV